MMTDKRFEDIKTILHGSQVDMRTAMTCVHELLAEVERLRKEAADKSKE